MNWLIDWAEIWLGDWLSDNSGEPDEGEYVRLVGEVEKINELIGSLTKINILYGEVSDVYIIYGDASDISVMVTNKDTGLPVEDLADTTEIKVQLKDSLDGDAIISKVKADLNIDYGGVAGKINIPFLPADFTAAVTLDEKYIGIQVERSATDKRELELTYEGIPLEKIEIRQGVIT
ncbi:MAG: hypothetical protein JXN64_06220 [Spirochaetes bacterium]|nr:hypothetical protein [Spirochaetota bacterium]